MRYRVLRNIIIICLPLLFFAPVIIYVQTVNPFSDPFSGRADIVYALDDTVRRSTALKETVSACIADNNCDTASIQHSARNVAESITRLKSVSADEKDFFVATADIELIAVDIKRYLEGGDTDALARHLTSDLLGLEHTRDRTAVKALSDTADKRREFMTTAAALVGGFLLLTSGLITALLIYSRRPPPRRIHDDIISALGERNRDRLRNYLKDIRFSDTEKTMMSVALKSEIDMEDLQERQDLYATLYNVLGYEIRDITNTIIAIAGANEKESASSGGSIISAARNLEGLADNFNELFLSGKSERSDLIDVRRLLRDIGVALASKTACRDGRAEIYMSRNLPLTVYGDYIRFFWYFLLQCSSEIVTRPGASAIAVFSARPADNVSNITLEVRMYFVDAFDYGIEALQNMCFMPADIQAGVGTRLMRHLISDDTCFSVSRYKNNNAELIEVTLDTAPHTYPDFGKPLEGRTILICGISRTPVDIVATILEEYGAAILYARSATEAFKAVGSNCNAAVIVEALPGAPVPLFCKTLKGFLEKHTPDAAIFAAPDANSADNFNAHVYKVFPRPLDPTLFVNSICEALQNPGRTQAESSAHALIIEDDPLQQMILGKLLSDQGVSYNVTDSGTDALRFLADPKTVYPAVIFLDCIMPGIDGFETARRIRATENASSEISPAAIIGASALSGNDIRGACIAAGMNITINKPYKSAEIAKIIKKHIACSAKASAVCLAAVISLFCADAIATEPSQSGGLTAFVTAALRDNYALNRSIETTRSEDENARTARAKLYPSLALTAGADVNKDVSFLGGEPGGDQSPVSADYALNISQPLYDMAAYKEAQAAENNVSVSQTRRDAAMSDTIQSTVIGYLSYLRAVSQIRATAVELKGAKERLQRIKTSFAAGNVTGIDVSESTSAHSRVASSLIARKSAARIARRRLQEITLYHATPAYDLIDIKTLAPVSKKDVIQWRTAARDNNPNVIIARLGVNGATLEAERRNAAFQPVLTFNAGYSANYNEDDTPGADGGFFENTSAGATLTIPLFNGGSRFSERKKSRHDITIARLNLQEAENATLSELDRIIETIATAAALSAEHVTTLRSDKRTYDKLNIAYKAGLRSLSDVLSAERALYGGVRDYLATRYDYFSAVTEAYALCGLLNTRYVDALATLTEPFDPEAPPTLPAMIHGEG